MTTTPRTTGLELGHERSRPGELPLDTLLPGDIGLVYDHKPSATHELIHARNRHIAGATEWANLTHAFVVTDAGGAIIEALSEGMTVNHVSKYKDQDFWIIHVPASREQRALAQERALNLKGLKYDFLAFVTEAMLCFQIPLSIRWCGQNRVFICSAATCYIALAYTVDFPRALDVITPCEIGMKYQLPIAETPAPLTFWSRLLDGVVTVGRLIGRMF